MRRLFVPVAGLVAGTVLAVASPARADSKATTTPTTPEPTRLEREHAVVDRGPNRLLLATGVATLGFAYGVSAWVGASTERPSERWLLVPVAGPWVTLARREDCGDPRSARCDVEPTFSALFVVSGLVQLGGAAQIVAAFLKRELRETDRPVIEPRVAVLPAGVPGGAALTARGSF